ncbi:MULTISPECIES: glycosyltransferase family 2 protein [unclassified Streptomyces]|uniref:glycosyltransferase n=1 Tax=unclassified Streptomyces TaxID=2593676 RepID=UPI00224E6462|nr:MULTISPECIES: glycosyltransferase [unclassified Streptomyces]MCX4992602.1 glycosyltransferase [Streptomyces sp. NBC_00568]MCX5002160.1 glycosyltransferase [Streptomyces sp. NBC_00638]
MTAAPVRSALVRPPVPVVDIDLARPGEFRLPGDRGPVRPAGQARALVRLHGRPLGMVSAADASGPDGLWRALADTANVELAEQLIQLRAVDRTETSDGVVRHPALQQAPVISVIVATRDRPEKLRHCLRSLLRSTYPAFEVILVDNAPADGATEALIHEDFAGRVRYVREPVAGLARAHNTGLARARGSVVAFTDDDTLVDPGWLPALAGTFARDTRIGCVTGLIVPAELETPAQSALEQQGGFAKGYVPRTWSLFDPPADPLFPFTAGRFGSGANMAFRTGALRTLGGFDMATGAGTPGRGGDDLLAFFEILAAGHTLAYQPSAIVWHCHRRTRDALAAQAFGYGAGLGAYLTGAVLRNPRRLPALLWRLPRGIRYAMTRSRDRGADPEADWSRHLALLEMRGMVYGPCGYLRGRLTGAGLGT